MIGITSYGGYIPRLRLNRMSIYQNMGWFAPAIVLVAQGERSFCNWDEDICAWHGRGFLFIEDGRYGRPMTIAISIRIREPKG